MSAMTIRHRRASGLILTVAAILAGLLISTQRASADDPPTCTQHKADGSCVVTGGGGTTGGGTSGGTTSGGGGGSTAPQKCIDQGKEVPCYDPTFGYFYTVPNYPTLHEYVRLASPQPPPMPGSGFDPWEGHTPPDGAVYDWVFVNGCGHCTDGGTMWLQNPPPGMAPPVDPAAEAAKLRAAFRLPQPTFHRSPKETNRYQGTPFTYVNIPTWFWTDPADYVTKTASITVGGVTITVTAKPDSLAFDPGNGAASKSCDGPGQAWTAADGNSASACSYTYAHVTNGTATSKLTVHWGITWTATGAQTDGGTLDPLYSESDSALRVLQVQVVDSTPPHS